MAESKTRRSVITAMSLPECKRKSDAGYPGKANHIARPDGVQHVPTNSFITFVPKGTVYAR
jgi:hypothetical protein